MKYTLPQLGKSIAGGLSAGGLMAATLLATPKVVEILPGWAIAALTLLSSLGSFLAVFFTKSDSTPEQIVRASEKHPEMVGEAIATADTAHTVISTATGIAEDVVASVIAQAGAAAPEAVAGVAADVLDQILKPPTGHTA